MRELTRQMESSLCDSPIIEEKMEMLAGALADAKGKKVYGYLKKPTKALVDSIVDELEQIAEQGNPYAQYLTGKLYRDGLAFIPDWVNARYWFEQASDQIPAAQYALGELLLTNDPEVRDPELAMKWLELDARNGSRWAAYRLGKEYLKGENVEKNVPRAMEYLEQSARAENQFAQYALGKLYLTEQNQEQAQYWFNQSASQGNQYAQFFLDRWQTLHPPSLMLSVIRLLYHMSRIFQDAPTPHSGGRVRIDRKRLAQLREKKIAMGHKPDDHEDPAQEQGWDMSMI